MFTRGRSRMEQAFHIIIGVKCPYCSRFRSPRDMIAMMGGAQICVQCELRHIEALDAMAYGVFTGECSECGLSADELRAQNRCGPEELMLVRAAVTSAQPPLVLKPRASVLGWAEMPCLRSAFALSEWRGSVVEHRVIINVDQIARAHV